MDVAVTPGIARPCGLSLTLGFRRHSLFEALRAVTGVLRTCVGCAGLIGGGGCPQDVRELIRGDWGSDARGLCRGNSDARGLIRGVVAGVRQDTDLVVAPDTVRVAQRCRG